MPPILNIENSNFKFWTVVGLCVWIVGGAGIYWDLRYQLKDFQGALTRLELKVENGMKDRFTATDHHIFCLELEKLNPSLECPDKNKFSSRKKSEARR